jgi:hypothetical protein
MAAVWTSNEYARARAYVPKVPTLGTIVEASETAHVVAPLASTSDAYTVASDSAFAAFRVLRARGYAKGLDGMALDDARADGSIAAWLLLTRYARRYGALPAYDRRQVMRRAYNAVRRALRGETRETEHCESLDVLAAKAESDAPLTGRAHLALESPALSLEALACTYETLRETLGVDVAYGDDDALAWFERRADAQRQRTARIGKGRVERMA